MSQDKTKEEILLESYNEFFKTKYTSLEGICNINWEDFINFCYYFYEHQLTQAKGEIERLKQELIDSASDDHYNYIVGCNNEINRLESLLTQKDKENERLEKLNAFDVAQLSDKIREQQKENEGLRAELKSYNAMKDCWKSLLNPSNEKGEK